MKCVICKQGETKEGTTTVTIEVKKTTLVIKKVPASVCQNCGEKYVDNKVTTNLLKQAEESAIGGIEVDVREYVAA